jgi:formamidopyrimidine-DNA glycosylase
MPELPEVASTAIRLNTEIQNRELTNIIVHSGRYMRHGNPKGMDEFMEFLPAKVNQVEFCGKLIIFEFIGSNGETWWCWNTLGMSGGWRLESTKHSHVEFVLGDKSVWFTDIRNFGTLKFTNDKVSTEKKRKSIGPNHLNQKISDELFEERLKLYPDLTIASSLMSQSLIGGIGNYIKAEVLYRARVSPHRVVDTLTKSEFSALNEACEEVIKSSFMNNGASIRTYYNVDGSVGEFPFFFYVYGRDTCINGFKVIRETTTDGRTTHWVPEIQI